MPDEPEKQRTIKQKLLFYTTAFFILLGTFSLFAFLFLVPFVIDPAFTTIFMEFDETPALCQTIFVANLHGNKNCTWTSCREGCTKDIYVCTQIYVNYHVNRSTYNDSGMPIIPPSSTVDQTVPPIMIEDHADSEIREDDYMTGDRVVLDDDDNSLLQPQQLDFGPYIVMPRGVIGLMPNNSYWYYTGAKLFPTVKGCGYPPILNCTIWTKKYIKVGTEFPCYYSRVDPMLVMSDLDMWQNTLNLVYAMGIPIPSFIISVIYLTFAYFKIYNEEKEDALLDKNGEELGEEEEEEHAEGDDAYIDVVIPNGATSLSNSGRHTPNSDTNKMAVKISRESLDTGVISNSGSIQGNLSKTMTTSISTPPGPTAAV